MKQNILFTLCLIWLFSLSATSKAQLLSDIEGMPPYKFGATAGMNISSFSADIADAKVGYNFGIDLMLDASDIIKNTYLRVGLLFDRKGAQFHWMDFIGDALGENVLPIVKNAKAKVRVAYIEIPVAYGYAYSLNKDWALLGEMGPYLAFGLTGHYHSQAFNENSYKSFFSTDFKFNGKTVIDSPKRLDLGWAIGTGVMFQSVHQVKLNYQFGFLNMNEKFLQNRNFSINYTYFFE